MDKMNWKDVWLSNYKGTSEAGKELGEWSKKNYKGHTYIPWATMVKWLYQMDEDATLEVIESEHGDYVHTSFINLNNSDKSVKEDVKTEKEIHTTHNVRTEKETYTTNAAHFVVLQCTFMGKMFEEVYPVQDNSYNAPNWYDSNMVNKAIQRAKAKVISTATGLGFKLYEDGDLQFEDDGKKIDTNKQNVVKEAPKVVKTVVEPVPSAIMSTTLVVNTTADGYPDDVVGIVDLILDNKDKSLPLLQSLNKDIVKTYGFSLSPEDSRENLLNKVNSLSNPVIFHNMFKKRLADSKGAK